jgi:hypothetical protein
MPLKFAHGRESGRHSSTQRGMLLQCGEGSVSDGKLWALWADTINSDTKPGGSKV